MRRPLLPLAAPLVLAALLAACTAGPAPLPPPDYGALRAEFDSLRAERDRLFQSEASPLPDSARARFTGLTYFPYDTTFAFRVRLRPALSRDTVLMATSTGEARPLVPYGVLRFERDGRAHTLTVFKPIGPGPAGHLFLPFQDLTSGTTTYGGGRYLDLTETPDGVYTLDFNRAYHPYCVYNPIYSCPIPPSENRLGLAVTAGERLGDGGA
ncbi:MAG TPA: DUF1684 domain-containing protein [Rubricoccaceae bacterium]|nr:DUF1684 domain-containing protein [Rubricoccaceae bacterium]